jgi:nitrate/nitrite transporter NarK
MSTQPSNIRPNTRPNILPNTLPNTRPLILGTLSFAVCFMAWGMISAFAPRFREMFSLSATQTALLVAVPVLLGSLARLPVGMLADRFGGRAVFTVLMLLVAAPAWLVPAAGSYRMLLVVAFFLGIAGSSFPVGVGFVSRWTPAERQGSALGVYGLGNIGQSAAVFLGPLLAARIGWHPVFQREVDRLVVAGGTDALLTAWFNGLRYVACNWPVYLERAYGGDVGASCVEMHRWSATVARRLRDEEIHRISGANAGRY